MTRRTTKELVSTYAQSSVSTLTLSPAEDHLNTVTLGRVRTPAVAAVVLTCHRRLMAQQTVQSLISSEHVSERNIVVVLNGPDPADRRPQPHPDVDVVRIPENLGPGGGFLIGLRKAFETIDAPWVYVCEDDMVASDIPAPRLERLLAAVKGADPRLRIGAVVAEGFDLSGWTGRTRRPSAISSAVFRGVRVGPWGAALVSREVFAAGVWPDDDWFFGYEDFDFFIRVAGAGFAVMRDDQSGYEVERSLRPVRSRKSLQPWRAYYEARNFFRFASLYGKRTWIIAHLLRSAIKFAVARPSARRAILEGLWDGARGKLGRRDGYEEPEGTT